MKTFKSRAVNSVKWTTSKTFIIAGVSILIQIILAKFIQPKEFANLSAIMIIVGFSKIIQNLGITQAVIQKEKIIKEEISSLFFFSTFLSLIIGGIIFFLSDLISSFYKLENLSYYIKLISISIFLSGPASIFRSILEKKLYFKEMAIIEIFSYVINLVLTTILLFLDFEVLAVVYSNIVAALYSYIALIILYYKKIKIGIRFYFRLSKIKSFLRFGIFVSTKDVMTYAAHRFDEVVIGYFLKPEVLGIYYFGKKILETLRSLMTKSFSKVLFPIFSNLSGNKKSLLSVYKKGTSYISLVSFPVFSGIAVTAHLFVPLIFGVQWIESIKVFQVFSILMIFMILTANISTSLLYSLNKPDIVLYIDIISNIIYFTFLFLFAKQGINFILIIYSTYIILKTLTLQIITNYYLHHSFKYYLGILKPNIVITLLMLIVVVLFQFLANGFISDLFILIGSIIIGLIAFITILLLFYKEIVLDFINTFKN